jgi:hypothetical protein
VESARLKAKIIALWPYDVLVAEDQDIVPADHEQVARFFAVALEEIRVGPEIEEDPVRERGQIPLGRRESDPTLDNGHGGATVRAFTVDFRR